MSGHPAYYYDVTEFEAGWGSRHDGYLIVLEKENKQLGVDAIHSFGDENIFSRVEDKANFCMINDKTKELIEARGGYLWQGDKKSSWLIRE